MCANHRKVNEDQSNGLQNVCSIQTNTVAPPEAKPVLASWWMFHLKTSCCLGEVEIV